jgi:hypothetical protein
MVSIERKPHFYGVNPEKRDFFPYFDITYCLCPVICRMVSVVFNILKLATIWCDNESKQTLYIVVILQPGLMVISCQTLNLSYDLCALCYIESNWYKTETLKRVFACQYLNRQESRRICRYRLDIFRKSAGG